MRYLVLLLLAGCQQPTLSYDNEMAIEGQFYLVWQLTKIPREQPEVFYNMDPDWELAGEADCQGWNITLNYRVAAVKPEFVLTKVVQHEVAHMVSCYYRGNMDGNTGDDHDQYWRDVVRYLGGDPDFV